MLRTCPKCSAYYADDQLAFCLADGAPLSEVEPESEEWQDGSRSIQEKTTQLGRKKLLRTCRRILLSGLATLMLLLLITQSYTVETTSPPIVVYKISGRLIFHGRPLREIKVRLEGSKAAVTTTDAEGTYSFTNLREGGSYKITPIGEMNFTPSNQSFDDLRRNESANFVGVIKSPIR